MSLRNQLTDQLKSAMKSRDQVKLDTVRFILSQIKNQEIDLKRELEDQEIINLIQKEVKNRLDALAQFRQAGRTDIIAEEEAKLEILKEYLPQQMSDQELLEVIEKVVNLADDKSFGKVMPLVMAEVKGLADGRRVSEQLKSFLTTNDISI